MSDRKNYRAGARQKTSEDLLGELGPPTWGEVQEWRKLWRRKANIGAIEQIWRTIPPGSKASESARRASDFALQTLFVPSDAVEFALSRLIVATMNGAMGVLRPCSGFGHAGSID